MLFFVYSCKESATDRISHLINEWGNKEIVYPARIYFTVYGQDTIPSYLVPNSEYSILTYVNTVDCISCKLQLPGWLSFIPLKQKRYDCYFETSAIQLSGLH